MKKCIFVLCILCALGYWLRRTDERVVAVRVATDDGTRLTVDDIEGGLFE